MQKICAYCGFVKDPVHNRRRPSFIQKEGKWYHEQCLSVMQRVRDYYSGKLVLPDDGTDDEESLADFMSLGYNGDWKR